MKKLKLGIIGSGDISKYHIDALKDSNFSLEAIAGSFGSKTAKNLAKTYKFKKYYSSPKELAKNSSNNLDALLICCNIESMFDYIKLAGKKIKILCEKPVTKNLKLLKKIKNKFPNVKVAYNRRFYESVSILRKKIKEENGNYISNIELPEKIFKSKNKFERVIGNSVHIFDLINYLFDKPQMTTSYQQINNKNFFKNFCFISKKKNMINLICNWNSPSNFKIEVFFTGDKYLLQPIEILNVYKGMNIVQPTKSLPIRTYVPNRIFQTKFQKNKLKYKPGFKIQAENFYNFVINKKNDLANLKDAYNALLIATRVSK